MRNQGGVFLEDWREDTDAVVFKVVSRTDRRSGQRWHRCKWWCRRQWKGRRATEPAEMLRWHLGNLLVLKLCLSGVEKINSSINHKEWWTSLWLFTVWLKRMPVFCHYTILSFICFSSPFTFDPLILDNTLCAIGNQSPEVSHYDTN